MLTVQVLRGAKGMSWRESLALSPLFFKLTKLSVREIARYSGMNPVTVTKLFAKRLTAWTLPDSMNGVPHLLSVNGLDSADPVVKLNKQYPHERHFRTSENGVYSYFWLGVPRRSCPLSPAENYLYWWLVQRIKVGQSRLSLKKAARLSTLPKPTVMRGVRRLLQLGWIKPGPDESFVLGDVEIDHFYQRDDKKRDRADDLRTLAALTAEPPADEPKSETEAKPRPPKVKKRKAEVKPNTPPAVPKPEAKPITSPFLDELLADMGQHQGSHKVAVVEVDEVDEPEAMLPPLPDPKHIVRVLADVDNTPYVPLRQATPPTPSPSPKPTSTTANYTHWVSELKRSHRWVAGKCGDIREAVSDGRMARWVGSGAVVRLYAFLHPACKTLKIDGTVPEHGDDIRQFFADLVAGKVEVSQLAKSKPEPQKATEGESRGWTEPKTSPAPRAKPTLPDVIPEAEFQAALGSLSAADLD